MYVLVLLELKKTGDRRQTEEGDVGVVEVEAGCYAIFVPTFFSCQLSIHSPYRGI